MEVFRILDSDGDNIISFLDLRNVLDVSTVSNEAI